MVKMRGFTITIKAVYSAVPETINSFEMTSHQKCKCSAQEQTASDFDNTAEDCSAAIPRVQLHPLEHLIQNSPL